MGTHRSDFPARKRWYVLCQKAWGEARISESVLDKARYIDIGKETLWHRK